MKLNWQFIRQHFKERRTAILAQNPHADLLDKLNQTAFGEAIGCDRAFVSDIANGNLSRIQTDRFDAVSNLLADHGFTLDEIWDTGTTRTAAPVRPDRKNPSFE